MAASKCARSLLLALLSTAASVHAQPQAELSFLLRTANWLGADEAALMPWETLEGFRSGRDTRARLSLGAEHAGAFRGLRTAALLRLDLALADVGRESELRLRDASSWLEVGGNLRSDMELRLRAFPLDTDYVRLGYAHALDWGGTDVARRESVFLRQVGGVPGAELSLSTPRARLFSWLKAARWEGDVRGPERVWGGAIGGSFSLSDAWRLDAGFGFFQRPPTFLEGVSARLVWHRGIREPELAAEPFRAAPFRADPERFAAEARPGFAFALEGVALVSRQRRYEDPAVAVSTLAPAAAAYGSLRTSRWAGHLLFSWRSVPFLQKNDPRVLPEQALPAAAPSQAELGAWLGGSTELGGHWLVPSLEVGAILPATISVRGESPQTFAVGGPNGFEALPTGAGRAAVLAARVSLRVQASPGLSLILATEYQRDPNRSELSTSVASVTRRRIAGDTLSQVVAAQARF